MADHEVDMISDVEVVERQKAVVEDVRIGFEGKRMTLSTIDEVLLKNGEVVFQCVHPKGDGCVKTYDSPRSVLAHQKIHAPRAEARRLQVELDQVKAEKEAAAKELAERKRRQAEGGKKAAATRIANAKQAARDVMQPITRVNPVTLLADTIEHEIEMVRDDLNDVKIMMDRSIERLAVLDEKVKLLRATPTADPTLIEKARRYDILTSPISQPIK